jgi:predicted dehydrogenase
MATNDQRPVRTAIVGTGNIARVHASALRELGAATEIVAAADIDDLRLKAFCDAHGIPRGYRDIAELLEEARPELVHLCTPPQLHHPHALSCLRAGSSVLAEKPPALSLGEFDEIAAAEPGPGTPGPWFATVFQHRFGRGHQRLKALTAAGALGRPLFAACHTLWLRDQAYFDVPWRGRWDTEGGGPTMGHGIHQMDMLADILGDWTEVSATARRQARRMETEDISLAHVTFGSGAVASIVNSVLSPREESYLRFDFERATVEVTHLYGYGDEDWRITPAPGCGPEVLDAWNARGEPGAPGRPGSPPRRTGHFQQFASVLRSLRQGTRPPVTPAESRRTLSLVTAIYASAFTGRRVGPADLGPASPFYARMDGPGARW